MKSGRIAFLILILGLVISCGGGGGSSPSGGGVNPILADNILLVTVNGALCSGNAFLNKPCVSVTVCTPGTANCQTINDILLDTGSFGLRIFNQALSVSLPQVSLPAGAVAECIQFADGASIWGPIKTAKVVLANEPAIEVPIQVIDSTFGTRVLPPQCSNSRTSPSEAGYSGILGVGLLTYDCGSQCTGNNANNGVYYSCNGGNCTGTAVALGSQVQNPVALLPQDNNGVIIQLPSIPAGGALSVNGALVFGIGTRSNNIPSGVVMYSANQFGSFNTTFNNTSYSGFLDTGSNGLFFSTSLLPNCPAPNSAWFCPSSTVTLSATNRGASGSPSGPVSFEIANFNSLPLSSNSVFDDIGGSGANLRFDWGLPFFFGRNIFVGIDGKISSLGTGPYWAY